MTLSKFMKEKVKIIKNLENNTNYDIRICSNYNEISSLWSETKTIKTNIDSTILSNLSRKNEFLKQIYEWSILKEVWN